MINVIQYDFFLFKGVVCSTWILFKTEYNCNTTHIIILFPIRTFKPLNHFLEQVFQRTFEQAGKSILSQCKYSWHSPQPLWGPLSPTQTLTTYMYHFFNWDSLYASLDSHYEAWSYKKKKHTKIKAYKKSAWKNLQLKGVFLDLKLDLKVTGSLISKLGPKAWLISSLRLTLPILNMTRYPTAPIFLIKVSWRLSKRLSWFLCNKLSVSLV